MTPLKTALERGLLSIRAPTARCVSSWTLCDLAGRGSPNRDDVSVALSFRQGEVSV